MSKYCPMCDEYTNCTDNCKFCLEENENAWNEAVDLGGVHTVEPKHIPVTTEFGDPPPYDDEKGADALWDKAAEIAVKIGLRFKLKYPEKFHIFEPVYAEDFGQEIIYNILKGDM